MKKSKCVFYKIPIRSHSNFEDEENVKILVKYSQYILSESSKKKCQFYVATTVESCESKWDDNKEGKLFLYMEVVSRKNEIEAQFSPVTKIEKDEKKTQKIENQKWIENKENIGLEGQKNVPVVESESALFAYLDYYKIRPVYRFSLNDSFCFGFRKRKICDDFRSGK